MAKTRKPRVRKPTKYQQKVLDRMADKGMTISADLNLTDRRFVCEDGLEVTPIAVKALLAMGCLRVIQVDLTGQPYQWALSHATA